jgi:hypothetical protein
MNKDMLSMTAISFALKRLKPYGTSRLPPGTLHLKNVETLSANPQEENNKEAAMIAYNSHGRFTFPKSQEVIPMSEPAKQQMGDGQDNFGQAA